MLRKDPEGVGLYLLNVQGTTLAPVDSTIKLTLLGLRADGAGGSRRTRVELKYREITLDQQVVPIAGTRFSHLSVLSRRADRIPLQVSLVAGSILNDGHSANKLQLRIINIDEQAHLTLDPGVSKFLLTCDFAGDGNTADWALATDSQVRHASIVLDDPGQWEPPLSSQGKTPLWTLTPKAAVTLKPGDAVALTMSGIFSSQPSGRANLYVRYKNIRFGDNPTYWDGESVVEVTKSPIVVAKDGKVGIGIPDPNASLHLVGGQFRVDNGTIQVGTNTFQVGVAFNADAETWGWKSPQPGGLKVVASVAGVLAVADEDVLEWHKGGVMIKGDLYAYTQYANRFKLGSTNTLQVGVAFNAKAETWSWNNPQPGGLKVVASEAGVLAVADEDVLEWHKGGIMIKGDLWAYKVLAVDSESSRLKVGNNSFQSGGEFKAGTPKVNVTDNYQWNWDQPSAGLRIIADGCGVLAVADDVVLEWHKGGVMIKGDLYAYNKYFRIAHPTIQGSDLIHACLEGPESAVYYRGRGRLREGRATVQLPEYFEALTRTEGRTVTLTAIGREPFLLSYEDVVEGAFRVHGTKPDGEFSWEVKAVRADVEPLEVEVSRR